MTRPAELAVLALRQVSEVLDRLSAGQLEDLAAGRGRLVFSPDPATPVTPAGPATAVAAAPRSGPGPTAGADLDVTVGEIRALASRDDVADYLSRRRLTVPVLQQVARRLGPTVAAGRSRAELTRNIIEGTAGFRERSAAMSGGAWS